MEIYLFSKNDYCTLLFKNILNQAEIHIKTFSNYEELKKNIQTNDPIAILLDFPNPTLNELMNWIELLKFTSIPVLLLSSEKENPNRILLRQKASLILGKPLIQYFRSLYVNKVEENQRVIIGDIIKLAPNLHFNVAKQCILKDNESLHLSSTEYKILYILVNNLGNTLSTEQLMDWLDLLSISSLYVHIANLRKKN